jgi:hypothetical protein
VETATGTSVERIDVSGAGPHAVTTHKNSSVASFPVRLRIIKGSIDVIDNDRRTCHRPPVNGHYTYSGDFTQLVDLTHSSFLSLRTTCQTLTVC